MNNLNANYDVVIVGAGPVGITTAASLKAMNKDLKICVIDKRPDPTRNHGLNIKSDSVKKIIQTLEQALNSPESNSNKADVISLKAKFSSWSNNFIRTNTIEDELAGIARAMGVDVLRQEDYAVKQDNLDQLLEGPTENEQPTELQRIFSAAKVIIGADGSHSEIRKKVMNDQKTDLKTLQYLVEVKFQTNSVAKPRGYAEASSVASVDGDMGFESMNRRNAGEAKPVTFHTFVEQHVFDQIRLKDDEGKVIKGDAQHAYTVDEFRARGHENIALKDISKRIHRYIQNYDYDNFDHKISTLEMSIFKSEESYKKYKGRFFLLAGDANSGMVLERGFNKGLKEGALCAKAVSDYFNRTKAAEQNEQVDSMEVIPLVEEEEKPVEFENYQRKVDKIFKKEKKTAFFKNSIIQFFRKILRFFRIRKR